MIITDINDNNPVIQQTDPVALSVVEHSVLGDVVTVISAVDIYDYDTNAQITYSITAGNSDSKEIVLKLYEALAVQYLKCWDFLPVKVDRSYLNAMKIRF